MATYSGHVNHRILREDNVTQIMAMLSKGWSTHAICNSLALHPTVLLRIMQKHGLMDLYRQTKEYGRERLEKEPPMSTNFYMVKDNHKVHLGKSSQGWAFLFQGYKTVTNIKEWYAQAQSLERIGYKLTNDNHHSVKNLKDLLILIKSMVKEKQHSNNSIYYDENGHCFCDLNFE